MTERKFTPPTTFPAEYVDGEGLKVVVLGRVPNKKYPLVGYDHHGNLYSWTNDGQYDIEYNARKIRDLHDIPKRITTWHNVYNGQLSAEDSSRERADIFAHSDRTCVYRIERDADGGNPTIAVEKANG